MLQHPAPGQLRQVTTLASVLLCDNPGHMTLEGTNTWILRASDSADAVVIDPGPDDEAHLRRVAEHGPVSQILLSHRHQDHSGGAKRFAEMVGSGVRAMDPEYRLGDEGLGAGDVVTASGVEIRVLGTPGHTADSLSFVLPGDGTGSVLTGDTVLGWGTTVISRPDGDLGDYLASLERLGALGPDITVLPGHGPELPDAQAVVARYAAHRHERLAEVREATAKLGGSPTARQVVEVVYADVDEKLWKAAEESVEAQLEYLRARG